MVNKMNVALALGKIAEIEVLMSDLFHLIDELHDTKTHRDYSVCHVKFREAKHSSEEAKKYLKGLINEN